MWVFTCGLNRFDAGVHLTNDVDGICRASAFIMDRPGWVSRVDEIRHRLMVFPEARFIAQ